MEDFDSQLDRLEQRIESLFGINPTPSDSYSSLHVSHHIPQVLQRLNVGDSQRDKHLTKEEFVELVHFELDFKCVPEGYLIHLANCSDCYNRYQQHKNSI